MPAHFVNYGNYDYLCSNRDSSFICYSVFKGFNRKKHLYAQKNAASADKIPATLENKVASSISKELATLFELFSKKCIFFTAKPITSIERLQILTSAYPFPSL